MSFFDLDSFTRWISQNPDWSLFIVFLIAFTESLAVIGLLVPGWLLLVGVGILIGTGNLNFYMASLFCFLGAVIGEYLSYLVGVRYQEKVHHWGIFRRHPDWLGKTEHFFVRYGIASVALGRFVGPVRAFVPLLAGMSGMPLLRFKVTNILSAMVWAPVYLIPGVIIGASVYIDENVRWVLLVNISIIAVSIWLVVSYLKNLWRVRHPEYKGTEFDSNHVLIKMFISLGVLLGALYFLLRGVHHEQFLQLVDIFWQTINQSSDSTP